MVYWYGIFTNEGYIEPTVTLSLVLYHQPKWLSYKGFMNIFKESKGHTEQQSSVLHYHTLSSRLFELYNFRRMVPGAGILHISGDNPRIFVYALPDTFGCYKRLLMLGNRCLFFSYILLLFIKEVHKMHLINILRGIQ